MSKKDYLLDWIAIISASTFLPQNDGKQYLVEYMLGRVLSDYKNYMEIKPSSKKILALSKKLDREYLPDITNKSIGRINTAPDVNIQKELESFNPKKSWREPQSFFNFASFLFIRNEFKPEEIEKITTQRYSEFDLNIEKIMGFNTSDALKFAFTILKEIDEKITRYELTPTFDNEVEKKQFYSPGFSKIPLEEFCISWKKSIIWDKNELVGKIENKKRKKFITYLKVFSTKPSDFSNFNSITKFNPILTGPILNYNSRLIVLIPSILWHMLPSYFNYVLLKDPKSKGRYIHTKGKQAEDRTYKIFNKIFHENNMFRRIKYEKKKGQPDADLIIHYKNELWFVENSAKQVTLQAQFGDTKAIKKDLEGSIIKCYKQAERAIKAYKKGDLKIPIRDIKSFKIIIVNDFQFPNMIFKLFSDFFTFVNEDFFPYVINNTNLELIIDYSIDHGIKKKFFEYVNERISYKDKLRIYCPFEEDLFEFFIKYGFYKYQKMLEQKDTFLHYNGTLFNIKPYHIIDGD